MQDFLSLLVDTLVVVLRVLWSYLEEAARLVVSRPEKEVRGEVAVVTGAAHGIGRELTLQLAGLGVRVAWLGSGVKVNASLEVTRLSDMLMSLPGILKE